MKVDESSDKTLAFHNAVMRFKCSTLTDEELCDMGEWIANSLSEKEEGLSKPWKATQGEESELSVENEYVQRYAPPSPQTEQRHRADGSFRSIDALPATLDAALEQIERSTGMKAIILLGGPAPSARGDINTHMYVLDFPVQGVSTYHYLGMRPGSRKQLTSPFPSPGKDMRAFTAHLLIGYVLCIVSSVLFCGDAGLMIIQLRTKFLDERDPRSRPSMSFLWRPWLSTPQKRPEIHVLLLLIPSHLRCHPRSQLLRPSKFMSLLIVPCNGPPRKSLSRIPRRLSHRIGLTHNHHLS